MTTRKVTAATIRHRAPRLSRIVGTETVRMPVPSAGGSVGGTGMGGMTGSAGWTAGMGTAGTGSGSGSGTAIWERSP